MMGLWPQPAELGLLTDLYELTMARAYQAEGMDEPAVFSLFFRELPGERNFMLACGQEEAAELVTALRFPRAQVERLRELDLFDDSFLRWLEDFRFSGEIHAMPEGTPVFPGEPLLEVRAPIAEAQLLETFLMNFIHLETQLASKAVRVVLAAGERPVVDFGMRRMHGMEASLRAVCAYRVAGIAGTSNVLGSLVHGLPARGTQAHSYIQAHGDETEALRRYARLYPGTTLLVDTYDTLAAVDKVIGLVRDEGLDVGGIRMDSGDLDALSREARKRLDDAGLEAVKILVSGGLDEWKIRDLVAAGAPVDGFGVGTEMGAVTDAPALDIAYKLTEYGGEGRLKNAPGKAIYPGRKQVWRFTDGSGRCTHDEITLRDEGRNGVPLLRPVVSEGSPVLPAPDPEGTRARVRENLAALPPELLSMDRAAEPYPVSFSPELEKLREEILKRG